MTTPTTNKTDDLIKRLAAYCDDRDNIADPGMGIVAQYKVLEIRDAADVLDRSTGLVARYAEQIQEHIVNGEGTAFKIDSLALEAAKLPVAQARFDNALSDLRTFLYHVVAKNGIEKDAVKALFTID